MRKPFRLTVAALALVLLILGGRSLVSAFSGPAKPPIATARVHRGNIDLRVYTVGDLRPVRSAMLAAPQVSGSLQIVHLAPSGGAVKPNDLVISFDPSEQAYKLEQSRFDLEEAEQNIIKSNADAAVQTAQDKLTLLTDRFNVRKAELDVSRNELLSSIDAQKNDLALQDAKRRLAQLEQDIKSHEISNRAAVAVLLEKRAKSQLEVNEAQQAIASMQMHSPLGGLVSVQENRDATGGFFFSGMVLPEFREGDQTRAGRPIAEVLDGAMELQVRLDESDRANISVGQPVKIEVDGLAGVVLDGSVKSIASQASRGGIFGDGSRRFDATFQVNSNDPRLRPGETARVTITGNHLENALLLPRQAVFERDGKPIVYLRNGSVFFAREVKVTHRTEGQVILEGLGDGAEVALSNPDAPAGPKAAGTATK